MIDLETITLKSGSHNDRDDGVCAMEAVAWLAGEPHTDHPQCTCRVLAAWMRGWNDGLPSDADRDRLLKPLLPRLLNTRSTKAVEERRSFIALDWLIREFLPSWLDGVESLKVHAAAIRALPEIADIATATQAGELVVRAAKDAAAAGDAAWAAAGDAARAAARAAAGAAAGDAARAAAWAAAGDAARDAAWAAAGDAAGDAARAAARAALRPTVTHLQASALSTFERMLAVTESSKD